MSIEQSVYCRVLGEGPDLLLLHGWGVNSAVWEPVLEGLSAHFRVHLIDLPGFGESQEIAKYSLDAIVERILQIVPEQSIWCGWSLGGLIASHASYLYPDKIGKLIQVCSSPKFVSEEDWPGVDSVVFQNFKVGLLENSDKTLARFIGLQAMGCASARKDTSTLKKLLVDTPTASLTALSEGLDVLNNSDLRSEFSLLRIPCLSMFGQFDSLVPIETSFAMQKLLPSSQQKIFLHSAHAPFISESAEFVDAVVAFSLAKKSH